MNKLTTKKAAHAQATAWVPLGAGANKNNNAVLCKLYLYNGGVATTATIQDNDFGPITIPVPANDMTEVIGSERGIRIAGDFTITPAAALDILAIFE